MDTRTRKPSSSPLELPRNPHALAAEQILGLLDSSPRGLTRDEARERLERFGPNQLTVRRGRTPAGRFLMQFHNVLIYVLLGAAVVTASLGHWIDTGVIIAVVLINAIVGFIQEGKAERALEAIRRVLSLKAVALRDGHAATFPASDLVPGDIVLVQSGDRVPADLRLIAVKNLRIEEAALTGESVPVDKRLEAVVADTSLGDRTCLAYSGTLVTFGQGRGVVVATGDATELAYCARHFDSVEINSTFYRLPEHNMLRTWRDAVPGDFVFAVKASRYITHMKKLNAPGAALKTFFRRIEALGDKLGPVLFQLPPRWHCSPRRLASFLGSLSSHFRYAFEFRDQSWSTSACTVRGHPTRDVTTGARSPAGRSRFSRGLRKDDRHSATSTTISSRTPN